MTARQFRPQWWGVVLLVTGLTGCELVSEQPPLPDLRPADHLVINEVFTLPPDNPTPYSWIEFYNPTADSVDLTGWTINYTCPRIRSSVIVQFDTAQTLRSIFFLPAAVDTVADFDVPFSRAGLQNPIDFDPVKLPPGGLFTIVSDEDRMLDHIAWGPGDERYRENSPVIPDVVDFSSIDTIEVTDTLITLQVDLDNYALSFKESAQIELKDPTGTVVDVVRFGNFVWPGPGPDPYPNNISMGTVPLFQSIQRYAYAYFTGNTVNDFYVSSSQVVPTPQWYSATSK